MSDENKLLEIPSIEWINLRNLYLNDWPNNCIGYYTIDNYMNWIKIKPNIQHLYIYSLNNDWSDGTFLIIDRYQLFLNSLNPSNDRLKIALSLIDWTHSFKISAFLDRHRAAVLDVIALKNLQKEYDNKTTLFYLPRENAAKFDVTPPSGIVLKPLTKNDALIIDKVWPNKHNGSLFFLKRLAAWNPNIGAFTNNGKLVAWCLRLQAGPLGALQVDDKYFRKGYGSLVCKAMAKKLANMNMDTIAFTDANNISAQAMLKKIGFKIIDDGYWLKTFPIIPFEWTDSDEDD